MTTMTAPVWLLWVLGGLALTGALAACWVAASWAERAADWLHARWRDRVTPLLEDDPFVLCDGCRNRDHCDGAEETCDCTCGWDEDWAEPLPPERTWEQMTSHQLPVSRIGEDMSWWAPPERERRAPWWEAEHRAAYESLGFDYPSGLMARVRELAP